MKKLLMTATAAAALAVPVVAGAHHQPGHQGGGGNSQNTVTINQPPPIVWGKTTTISGTVQGPNNAGVAVELQADEFPFLDAEFTQVAEGVADAVGNYTFANVKPTMNTRYRVLARTSPPATSVPTTVGVRIKVRRSVSFSPGEPEAYLAAEACPKHDGQPTRFQRRRDGKWRTVKTLAQQPDLGGGPCSAVAATIRRDGRYRAVVPDPAGHHLKGRSRPIRVNVPN